MAKEVSVPCSTVVSFLAWTASYDQRVIHRVTDAAFNSYGDASNLQQCLGSVGVYLPLQYASATQGRVGATATVSPMLARGLSYAQRWQVRVRTPLAHAPAPV